MNKIHWYYKFLTLSLLFFSMFFLYNKNISHVINNSTYKYYLTSFLIPISNFSRNSILNCKSAVKENNNLKQRVLKTNNLEEINNNLQYEMELLKKTMKLKSTYTGYDVIYAKTINRNKMYWYSTIIIDKGYKDGVKKDSAVVSIDGLVGVIKSVTKGNSTVKLITNSDINSKISGMIKYDDFTAIGLIEGYEYPYIKVNMATYNKKIKPGDEFYSSGLADLPKNIYIGTVKKIEKDNYGLSNILYVEPKQDMNDINYVAILNNR